MKRLKLCRMTSCFTGGKQSRALLYVICAWKMLARPENARDKSRGHTRSSLFISLSIPSTLRDIVLDTSRLLHQVSKAIHVFRTPSHLVVARDAPSFSRGVTHEKKKRKKKKENRRGARDKREIISPTENIAITLAHHRAQKIDRQHSTSSLSDVPPV